MQRFRHAFICRSTSVIVCIFIVSNGLQHSHCCKDTCTHRQSTDVTTWRTPTINQPSMNSQGPRNNSRKARRADRIDLQHKLLEGVHQQQRQQQQQIDQQHEHTLQQQQQLRLRQQCDVTSNSWNNHITSVLGTHVMDKLERATGGAHAAATAVWQWAMDCPMSSNAHPKTYGAIHDSLLAWVAGNAHILPIHTTHTHTHTQVLVVE